MSEVKPKPKRNKHATTVYLEADQIERLCKLSEKTRIPKAVLVRMGLEILLEKYKNLLPGQILLVGRSKS